MLANIVTSAKKAFGFPTEQKAYSLTDPGISDVFGPAPTASGVVVTAYSAIKRPGSASGRAPDF